MGIHTLIAEICCIKFLRTQIFQLDRWRETSLTNWWLSIRYSEINETFGDRMLFPFDFSKIIYINDRIIRRFIGRSSWRRCGCFRFMVVIFGPLLEFKILVLIRSTMSLSGKPFFDSLLKLFRGEKIIAH